MTAREGALKIRESAHLLAEGFDSELLLHGAAVPYGRQDTLVGIAPEADADGLTAGLAGSRARLRAWRRSPLRAKTVTDGSRPRSAFLAQIPVTVRLQLLAAQLTEANGHRSRSPRSPAPGLNRHLWAAGAPVYLSGSGFGQWALGCKLAVDGGMASLAFDCLRIWCR